MMGKLEGELFPVEIDDRVKFLCLSREIKYREYVYPRRVLAGKMTKQEASYELAVMRAIAKDYQR